MIERWGEETNPELVWKSIPGFFDFSRVYDRVAEQAKDGDVLVEVGCLLGRSACYLGEKFQAAKKKVTLICVDAWPSTYNWGADKSTKIESPFETFLANVRQSGLQDIIFPIRAKSVRAASSIVRYPMDSVQPGSRLTGKGRNGY